MPSIIKDTVPVDPDAELSLDNVLADIRLRGEAGYKLRNYTFSSNFDSVELEFVRCTTGSTPKSKKT